MRPRGRSTAPMMVRASRRSSQGRPVYVMDVHVDRGCGPGACGTITTSPRTGPVTLVDIPHTTCSSSFVATDGLQQRTSASYRLGRRPTPKEKVPSERPISLRVKPVPFYRPCPIPDAVPKPSRDMITPRARRRPSPRTTATFSPAQRPKTRFPASTGRRCVGLSVCTRRRPPPHQRIATT